MSAPIFWPAASHGVKYPAPNFCEVNCMLPQLGKPLPLGIIFPPLSMTSIALSMDGRTFHLTPCLAKKGSWALTVDQGPPRPYAIFSGPLMMPVGAPRTPSCGGMVVASVIVAPPRLDWTHRFVKNLDTT